MGTITFEDFQKTCEKNSIPYPKIEAESFYYRRNRNAMLCQMLIPSWNQFEKFLIQKNENKYILNQEKISENIELTGIYIESLIHTGSLLFDCLLHIINKTVFRFYDFPLDETEVGLKKVKNKLKNTKENNLYNLIENFEKSFSYNYFHDFDIVSKHRGIMVKQNFFFHAEKNQNVQWGTKILSFSNQGRNYKEIFQQELIHIYEDYHDHLILIYEEIYFTLKRYEQKVI